MRSLDAGILAKIDDQSLKLATCVRLRTYPDTEALPGSHRYWKFEWTDNNGASDTSVAEIELRATYGGADQTAPGGAITGSTTAAGSYANAIDNSVATAWDGSGSVGYLIYDFTTPTTVKEFAYTCAATVAEAAKDFGIYFSDDGVVWTLLQSFTGETGWASQETRVYDLSLERQFNPNYIGYTNHDNDIVLDNITYYASTGYSYTDISGSGELNVDNLDLVGMMVNSGIDEAYIEAGGLDGAQVRIFMVDWSAPTDGTIELMEGVIGEVTRRDGAFIAEIRSKAQHVQQHVLEVTSNHCRAEFGDARCKVNIYPNVWKASTSVTVREDNDAGTGTVIQATGSDARFYKCTTAGTTNDTEGEPTWDTTIGNSTTETDGVVWECIQSRRRVVTVTSVVSGFEKTKFACSSLDEPDDWWQFGRVIWTGGDNINADMEVQDFVSVGGNIVLYLPMYNDITVGDTLIIEAGCNKDMDTDCKTKFDNLYNFRGEPFVPGLDVFATGKKDGQYIERNPDSLGGWFGPLS